MCIYLGDGDNLTYKKQEHIFPAGLGGRQMLDVGVVSDQASELFSPLERKLMHQSLIAFNRMMFGPGKRGSLNPQRASKSRVNVGLQDNGKPVLCYTALGKPYFIPQCHFHVDKAVVSVPYDSNDSEKQLNDFRTSLEEFNEDYIYLQSEYVPQGDILVGSFEGKIYVSSSYERPDTQKVQEIITILISNFKIDDTRMDEQRAKQVHHLEESPEISRMYAKVAMNVLAFLKGEDYVKHPNFDDIRKWIVTGNSENEFSFLPNIQAEPLDMLGMIPDKAHWCILMGHMGYLEEIVCFYNCYYRRFTMGKLPDGIIFLMDGFICDWQNKIEYSVQKFIEKITLEHNPDLYTVDKRDCYIV